MPRKIYADSFEEAILKMIDEESNGTETGKQNRKQKAMEDLAKTNKQLYDAHIKVGFTPEQAIQLVAAGNMR